MKSCFNFHFELGYAPGSRFSPHIHTGGEEFLVLDGVFQDEHGDYPKGTYVRNPPTSSHSPGSEQGCTILVKLWYFDMDDRQSVVVDTLDNQLVTTQMGNVRTRQLYSDEREIVAIEQWAPGVELSFETSGGSEIFVLEGSFTESGDELVADSWLRVPRGTNFKATVGQSGAEVWIKKLQRNPDWI